MVLCDFTSMDHVAHGLTQHEVIPCHNTLQIDDRKSQVSGQSALSQQSGVNDFNDSMFAKARRLAGADDLTILRYVDDATCVKICSTPIQLPKKIKWVKDVKSPNGSKSTVPMILYCPCFYNSRGFKPSHSFTVFWAEPRRPGCCYLRDTVTVIQHSLPRKHSQLALLLSFNAQSVCATEATSSPAAVTIPWQCLARAAAAESKNYCSTSMPMIKRKVYQTSSAFSSGKEPRAPRKWP